MKIFLQILCTDANTHKINAKEPKTIFLNYGDTNCFAISSEKQGTLEIIERDVPYIINSLKTKNIDWFDVAYILDVLEKWSSNGLKKCVANKIPTRILFNQYSDDKFDWFVCNLNKKNSVNAMDYIKKREAHQLLSKDFIFYSDEYKIRISHQDAKIFHNELNLPNFSFKNTLRRCGSNKKEYGSEFKTSDETMIHLINKIYEMD